jgi:hypothetical protein
MLGVSAGDLKNTFIQHHHSKGAEGDAGSDENFIHVVESKTTGLFDPVFEDRKRSCSACTAGSPSAKAGVWR